MIDQAPQLDPDPLSEYVAWAGRRNRDPLLRVFKQELSPSDSQILEFASGSGMHINYFAPHFPAARFQPSDKVDRTFENIRSLRDAAGCNNVDDPIVLDLTEDATWPSGDDRKYNIIFCINIYQVAPVSIAVGMMRCAASLLSPGGRLMIYGPFKVDGSYRSDTDAMFDAKLNVAGVASWGLKDVADLDAAAQSAGLTPGKRTDMPVNNLLLAYLLT